MLLKNAAERRSSRARLIWGANPVSREGERPRPVAFARTGKLVRTAARFDGALPEAQRDYCARRPPPDLGKWKRKSPRPVSRRGPYLV